MSIFVSLSVLTPQSVAVADVFLPVPIISAKMQKCRDQDVTLCVNINVWSISFPFPHFTTLQLQLISARETIASPAEYGYASLTCEVWLLGDGKQFQKLLSWAHKCTLLGWTRIWLNFRSIRIKRTQNGLFMNKREPKMAFFINKREPKMTFL